MVQILSQAKKRVEFKGINPFSKRHRLVHNGKFPNFEALYCSLDVLNSTEIL